MKCQKCGTEMVKRQPTYATEPWDKFKKVWWVCPQCGHVEFPDKPDSERA